MRNIALYSVYCGTHFEYKIALQLIAQLIQFPNHESTSTTAKFLIDDCSISQVGFDYKVKWVYIHILPQEIVLLYQFNVNHVHMYMQYKQTKSNKKA